MARRRDTQDKVVSSLIIKCVKCRLELLRADADRRFPCRVIVLIPNDSAHWNFGPSAAVARSGRKLRNVRRGASLASGSLWERERDHAHGQEQKQIKRASNKMRFNRGANVRFHLACASVCKRLLLEARQSCRDNLPRLSSAFLLHGRSYGRSAGEGRDRGVEIGLGV